MHLNDIIARARHIRSLYEKYERETYGREWSTAEFALGLVVDIGDLAKLIQASLGVRGSLSEQELDAKLSHELADCLWAILVLADKLQINLGDAFVATMDEVEARLGSKSVSQ